MDKGEEEQQHKSNIRKHACPCRREGKGHTMKKGGGRRKERPGAPFCFLA